MTRMNVILAVLLSTACSSGLDDGQYGLDEDSIATVSQALVSESWAFAWSHDSNDSVTAHQSYSRNSTGNSNGAGVSQSVTHLEKGRYRVTLPGVGTQSGGHLQVTAYGNTSHHCKVRSWGNSGSAVNAYIDCYKTNGNPVNARFSIAYVRKAGMGSSHEAYLWADQSTSSSYTPSQTYQFNSHGGVNTVTRQGTGQYTVRLPGQPPLGGTVHVTAYGTDSDYCNIVGWWASGNDTLVGVRCYNAAGNLANSRFNLNFANGTAPLGGFSYSYLFADQPDTSEYSATPHYSRSYAYGIGPLALAATIERTARGRYSVTLPGMTPSGSNVQVTAYGGKDRCKIISWSGTPTVVKVACFDADGDEADSMFVLGYVDDEKLPGHLLGFEENFVTHTPDPASIAVLDCGNYFMVIQSGTSDGTCYPFLNRISCRDDSGNNYASGNCDGCASVSGGGSCTVLPK